MAVCVVVDVAPNHQVYLESAPPKHDFAHATCECGWEYGGDPGRTATAAEQHLELGPAYLRYNVVRSWL